MKEISNKQLRKLPSLHFSISRAFRTVDDLRNWIQNPQANRTNNGFLTVQIPKREHANYEQHPSDRTEIEERINGDE